MDWFSWLSNTSLDPSLVYEYGLAFAQNELEEDDIPHFTHEFLQSMGISIAKHRLEILKLARKVKGTNTTHSVSRVLIAIKQSKRRLSNYLRAWMRCEESALAVHVPRRRCYSERWKKALVKRSQRSVAANRPSRPPLLITNEGPTVFPSSRINSFSGRLVHEVERDEEKKDGEYDEYWSSAVKEVKWDTMFQNLKPT